ncbi:MAG: ABC transporter substrate-binding protein [Bacillota bacterium]|nr:ABC transporter substrate-binding protein [Bacillota bacterium]
MKKKNSILLSLLTVILLISTTLIGCSNTKTDTTLKKVRLNEVTRSVFYAPMYAAISNGYFKEEGIQLDISTGEGADKTMQQVLSKNADIGFCGPEQTIYIYNQKRDDYPVLFAQLTQRDGSFLISRTNDKNFNWESLEGKNVLGGRPGGVPEMALEYVLRNHGLVPGKNLNVITNVAFSAAPGAFKGGTGDYAALFEPSASALVKDKSGYIVASVGASAGPIPYTCFFTTKSYMDNNKDTIQKFTNAIYKGQIWVSQHSDAEVAKAIKSYFPGTDEAVLQNVIKNYRAINAYAPNPIIKEENMSRLMDIIQSYNSQLLKQRPPFSKIVNNEFSNNAVNTIKPK